LRSAHQHVAQLAREDRLVERLGVGHDGRLERLAAADRAAHLAGERLDRREVVLRIERVRRWTLGLARHDLALPSAFSSGAYEMPVYGQCST
jgi:hypothetical protein